MVDGLLSPSVEVEVARRARAAAGDHPEREPRAGRTDDHDEHHRHGAVAARGRQGSGDAVRDRLEHTHHGRGRARVLARLAHGLRARVAENKRVRRHDEREARAREDQRQVEEERRDRQCHHAGRRDREARDDECAWREVRDQAHVDQREAGRQQRVEREHPRESHGGQAQRPLQHVGGVRDVAEHAEAREGVGQHEAHEGADAHDLDEAVEEPRNTTGVAAVLGQGLGHDEPREGRHEQREGGERPEDDPPRRVRDDECAEDRGEHRSEADDRLEETHRASQRLAVCDVDEDRAAHRGGDAAAEALEDSAHEEHPDARRKHADYRADEGDDAARDDGAAAPDLVRDGAAQDLAGREADEEGRERKAEHRRVRRQVHRDLRERGRIHVGRHRRHGVLHGQRDQQGNRECPADDAVAVPGVVSRHDAIVYPWGR